MVISIGEALDRLKVDTKDLHLEIKKLNMDGDSLPVFIEPNSIDSAALAINKLGKNLHEHAYICGKLLIWVKPQVGHGNFEQWIENNVWFGVRTAQKFMHYSIECDSKLQLLDYHSTKSEFNSLLPQPSLPAGIFDVILADPPWRYDFNVESRATEKHYPTLTQEQISNYIDSAGIPIQDKFADNAILFLWATAPKLNEAMQVVIDWGFTYKTNMVWVKDKIGLGWYCRNQHELLLIAEKGNMPLPQQAVRPSSVINAPRNNHSRKPDIYEMIEMMYPSLKYLECFGLGHHRPNWVTFGNDIYK